MTISFESLKEVLLIPFIGQIKPGTHIHLLFLDLHLVHYGWQLSLSFRYSTFINPEFPGKLVPQNFLL